MFGPPGSLSETSLAEAGDDAVPAAWGVFPRTMMHLLRLPGLSSLHASAVEVYGNHAFDLLNGREPLAVGKSRSAAGSAGRGLLKKEGNWTGKKQADGRFGKGNLGMEAWAAAQREKAERKGALEARREAAAAARRRPRQAQAASGGGAKGEGGRGGGGERGGGGRVSAVSRGGGSRTGGTGGSSGGGRRGSSSGGGGSSDGSSETAFATAGETLQEISSDADVARLARLVEATRVAKGHALNDRSSRSHCLVHVHVVQNVGGTVSKRQMLFVDLAGSEVRGFKCHQSVSVFLCV